MTEDIEERFRRACSAYLADVEHAERQRERAAEAALEAESARMAADRSRDALVLVVRERDVLAQLVDSEGRIHPSERAAAAQARWLAAQLPPEGRVTWMTPQRGSQRWHDMVAANICPECGVSWDERSDACPKVDYNRHPLH